MLVKLCYSLQRFEIIETPYNHLKEILSFLKLTKGKEFTDSLINTNYVYMLEDAEGTIIPLHPEVILSELPKNSTLIALPEVLGHGTAIVIALGIAGSTAAAITVTGAIVAAIINIVISLAITFLISLLSPTPEFSDDPSQAQLKQSNLFNGAPMLRNQGGSVPIVYGNPFAGGVLISSGVSTEDI